MKKRFLATAFTLVLAFTLIPAAAASQPGADSDGPALAWAVEPTLEYGKIFYCGICGIFGLEDHSGNILDSATGSVVEGSYWDSSHDNDLMTFLYDEPNELYGFSLAYDNGGGSVYYWDMLSPGEFEGLSSDLANQLNVFREIDADQIIEETDADGSGTGTYDLSGAYTGSKYALANGTSFITGFIYDEIRLDNSAGRIQLTGDNIIEFIVDRVNVRNNAAVKLNGKWGILDKAGNNAAPFVFDDVLIINDSAAFAKYNGMYGILDLNGTAGPGSAPASDDELPQTGFTFFPVLLLFAGGLLLVVCGAVIISRGKE